MPAKKKPAKAPASTAIEMEVLPALPEVLAFGKTSRRTTSEIGRINDLHQRANGLADEATSKARQAGHLAFLAGMRLLRFKEALPHGSWGKLFPGRKNPNSAQNPDRAEFEFGFSQDTAGRYMALATNLIAERNVSGKKSQTLLLMADSEALSAKDHDFLDKLTDGESITDLYESYGVITRRPADKRGGPGGARTADKKTPDQVLEAERKLALQDAKELAALVDDFIRSKKPTLLDKDHHSLVTDAISAAAATLKKIKL